MLKLKRVMGNVIKCRVDMEYMVSQYEAGVLQNHPVQGLLKLQIDKTGDLTYTGAGKRTLTQQLLQKMGQQQLAGVIRSALQTVCELRHLGLNEHRLLLNPDWVFSDENGKVYFLYLPVNGIGNCYDFLLFCRDIILSAELTESERRLWKRWTDELSKEGIRSNSMERFLTLFQMKNSRTGWNDSRTVMDEEEDTGWSDPEQTDYDEPDNSWDDGSEATIMDSYEPDEEDDMDYGDTVLDYDDDDMDETLMDGYVNDTVAEHRPTIRRLSTGEKKVISGDDFKIGRSASRADFCITGNHCISNVHAIIVCIGDTYYIKDNYSTNGTYVDGEQIHAGDEPKRLSDGSMIRMWDEDFEFCL